MPLERAYAHATSDLWHRLRGDRGAILVGAPAILFTLVGSAQLADHLFGAFVGLIFGLVAVGMALNAAFGARWTLGWRRILVVAALAAAAVAAWSGSFWLLTPQPAQVRLGVPLANLAIAAAFIALAIHVRKHPRQLQRRSIVQTILMRD